MEKEQVTQLVIKCQNGDLEAMEQLMLYAYKPVSFQCRKMMKNEQDAEDLTQEVLLAMYEKIGSLKDPTAFHKWINTITANRCLNALGNPHKEYQIPEDEDGNSMLDTLEDLDEQTVPDKALDNAETCRMINEVVQSLPEAQRMCTLMFYFNEMSVKEIAQALEVSENTVKSRLNYARKAIKEQVLDYEKQGVKLYSVSPIGLLLFFLRRGMEEQSDPKKAAVVVRRILPAGTKAAAGVLGGAAQAAPSGVAAATGQAGFWNSVAGFFSGKAAIAATAAVAAAAVGVGSVAAINTLSKDPSEDTTVILEEAHLHEFSIAEQVAAKCEIQGHITFLCECGETKEEVLPALEHLYLPDEESDDPNQFRCSLCGVTMVQEETECEHEWETERREPTCIQDGLERTVCRICGYIQPDSIQTLPKNPNLHNWSSWYTTVSPTVTETGLETRHCTACGLEQTNVLPILDHVHLYEVKMVGAGTCQEPGVRTKVCQQCGDVAEETVVSEHSWETEKLPPNCVSGTLTTIYCKYCYYVSEQTMAHDQDPNNHVHLETIVSPASCVTPKTTIYECQICGYYDEKAEGSIIPDAHHIVNDETFGGDCTNPPYKHYICSYCRGQERTEYGQLDPNAHMIGIEYIEVATCVRPAIIHYVCKSCGGMAYTEMSGQIDSSNHCAEDGSIVLEDCVHDGYSEKHCADCGYQLSYTVRPATGNHAMCTTWVAPTENSEGYTLNYCNTPGCGYSFKTDIIPPLTAEP